MVEYNFNNADIKADNKLIFFNDIEEKDLIKIDSTSVFLRNLCTSDNINANYSLIVLGNIEANEVSILKDLICIGNIKCKRLEVTGECKCFNQIDANEVHIGNNLVISEGVIKNGGQVGGNLIIDRAVDVSGDLHINKNVIANEGTFGDGIIDCKNIIANDFIENDVKCKNINYILEDSSRYKVNKESTQEPSIYGFDSLYDFVESKDFSQYIDNKNKFINNQIKKWFTDIESKYKYNEIEEILSKLSKLSPIFKKSYLLFKDILDFSYNDKIDKLDIFIKLLDYKRQLPKYISNISICRDMFGVFLEAQRKNIKEMDLSTIKTHREFTKLLNQVENIKKYLSKDEYFYILDKIYSHIGIKTSMVKRFLDMEG